MRHVLVLGNPVTFLDDLDFPNDTYSCMLHRSAAERLPAHARHLFAEVVPLPFDIRELDICTYEKNYGAIEQAALELNSRREIDAICGNDEHIILPACRLREKLGLPGTRAADAELFRNKLAMKKRLAGTAIPAPRFLESSSFTVAELRRFFESCPGGVVLKPVAQAASIGVTASKSWAEIERAFAAAGGELNAEELIAGDVFQLDGAVVSGQLRFFSCARYLRPPLEWEAKRAPIASVMIDDAETKTKAIAFAQEVIRVFPLRDYVFHLEAFFTGGRFVFLEIASRPGGAGTQKAIAAAFGINLPRISIQMELGKSVEVTEGGILAGSRAIAGYLILPPASGEPHTVRGYQLDLRNEDGLLIESSLASVGTSFYTNPIPYHSPASFVFKGDSTEKVSVAMMNVIAGTKVIPSPLLTP